MIVICAICSLRLLIIGDDDDGGFMLMPDYYESDFLYVD